jgi:hypothetical protein
LRLTVGISSKVRVRQVAWPWNLKRDVKNENNNQQLGIIAITVRASVYNRHI